MLVSIWWYVCFRVVLVSIWLHVSVSVYCWIAFGDARFPRALLVNTWLQLMLSCCVLYYLAHSQNCTFRRMRTSESVDFVCVFCMRVGWDQVLQTLQLRLHGVLSALNLVEWSGSVSVVASRWFSLRGEWALFFVLWCCCMKCMQ